MPRKLFRQTCPTPLTPNDCASRTNAGLHARASAKFVQTVDQFDADVQVSKDGHTVCGTSIMGLMMLAAAPGCHIDVVTSGNQAEDVLNAISKLIEDRFGEGE